MSFITVKKGTRPSEPKIYISEVAKTITFSTGFYRTFGFDLDAIGYVRLAFDPGTKEIAFEFSQDRKNSDEYMKLSFTANKTSASCSINPILTTFSINISEISGTYRQRAISGPTRIHGFSENGFILRTMSREA